MLEDVLLWRGGKIDLNSAARLGWTIATLAVVASGYAAMVIVAMRV